MQITHCRCEALMPHDFLHQSRIFVSIVARGANFRYGFAPHLEGSDLVVWLAMESTKPTRVEFAAAK